MFQHEGWWVKQNGCMAGWVPGGEGLQRYRQFIVRFEAWQERAFLSQVVAHVQQSAPRPAQGVVDEACGVAGTATGGHEAKGGPAIFELTHTALHTKK